MPWWTKVPSGKMAGVKKHKTKLDAGIELRFAILGGSVSAEECGLYKRDPQKHPDEPNLLEETVARAERVMANKRAKSKRSR